MGVGINNTGMNENFWWWFMGGWYWFLNFSCISLRFGIPDLLQFNMRNFECFFSTKGN